MEIQKQNQHDQLLLFTDAGEVATSADQPAGQAMAAHWFAKIKAMLSTDKNNNNEREK
ncbi:hypothetical protein [uncultured Limnobacter sp.]|uniref:hypothetical protein n=1 Tax=uncultured Limnobacter sp. TaxID=199681 RepID=UPI0032B1427A|tara:strand:+ start:45 stop:218 length:174 start_codon:yes stop_codon:yes gene_type:complete